MSHTPKWPSVPSEGGFYGMCFTTLKFQQESCVLAHTNTFKPNSQLITLAMKCQAVKTDVALKSLGEKIYEIKGGGQEITTKMLRFISFRTYKS